MKRLDSSGIETPLSVMFLMVAFLLIASIGPIFMDSKSNEDITELKSSQARSIGFSIIRSIEFSELTETREIEMDLLWNNGMAIYRQYPCNISDRISDVLMWVPSNTWVFISIRNGSGPDPSINIDVISWSARILENLDLWVFLPLERSPPPQIGGIS